MDHGIEGSELVHLVGKGLRFCDAGKISRNSSHCARDFGKRLICPIPVAAVQHDLVALADQQSRLHETETVRRTGYEYFCHG